MDLEQVRRLVDKALHDSGGDLVEGAFADQWVSTAWVAMEELRTMCQQHGFPPPVADLIRQAMIDPAAGVEAVANLVHGLRQWTGPIVDELAAGPSAHARLVAVHLATFTRPADARARLLLARGLEDADAAVRRLAASHTVFAGDPQGGRLLLRCFERESEPENVRAIIAHIAAGTRSAGLTRRGWQLTSYVGEGLVAVLRREVDNEDAATRRVVAMALERTGGEDEANAPFEQLLRERDPRVICALLAFDGYAAIAERSFPVISALMREHQDPAVRVAAAWLMPAFGAPAVPHLLERLALRDEPLRRPCVMGLGSLGELRALPPIMRELADPDSRTFRREIEDAIRSLLATRRGPTWPPTAAASARVQALIDQPPPAGLDQWPARFCREDLDALPVLATAAMYVYAVRADGTVWELDVDAAGHAVSEVTDPVRQFAVVVQGCSRHPELAELLRLPPHDICFCTACNATGTEGSGSCVRCGGFGWLIP